MLVYTTYTNATLLQLLSESDELAFAELYDRFWKKLFTISYNRLKEIESAEDIVHDVFAALWKNRGKIEIAALENYLATAVKYAVLSKIKSVERERMYKSSIASAPVVEMDIESALHFKRLLEIVKKEVELLPEKCRLIFNYSRQQGMPVKEIAEELHISPKTVENQLNKALKQIKMAARPFLTLLSLLFLF
jgi:RNA polymerase sigma-70 factor (ECF subfamily)